MVDLISWLLCILERAMTKDCSTFAALAASLRIVIIPFQVFIGLHRCHCDDSFNPIIFIVSVFFIGLSNWILDLVRMINIAVHLIFVHSIDVVLIKPMPSFGSLWALVLLLLQPTPLLFSKKIVAFCFLSLLWSSSSSRWSLVLSCLHAIHTLVDVHI